MPPKVAILGGGVSGMSAAHELAKRGFAVEVFEARSIAGGKARSLPIPQTPAGATSVAGAGARKPWLPGEHGFRFFPRFYQHIVKTMGEIPVGNGRSVADNLVDTTRGQIARFDRPGFYLPTRFPQSPGDFQTGLHLLLALLAGNVGVTLPETAKMGAKVWQIFTSCEERRFTEYERIPWWTFIEAPAASDEYKRYFGHGITRSLVAAKARRASTKTIGNIFTQLIYDILRPGVSADRVLNGPTNDVWIDPWLALLNERGVAYHFNSRVKSIECAGGVVRGAVVVVDGEERRVGADFFVSAMPIERIADLLSPDLLAADPSLENLRTLKGAVEWMNGIQFYLTEDVPLCHGHTVYLDSPWALTSISQPQFWSGYDLSNHGDGKVRGIISVDISNWIVPGLNGKAAKDCTAKEIAEEVWRQLKRSVNIGGAQILRDDMLHFWFLDEDIVDDNPDRPGSEVNTEPLLVNYVDTWALRPEAVTRIPNFFLAGDYVRTTTDLATMEAANESARRAVNGILNATRSNSEPCELFRFQEPEVLAPLRAYDLSRFRQGLPWDGQAMSLLTAVSTIAGAFEGPRSAPTNDDPMWGLQKSARDLLGMAHAFVGVPATSLSDVSPPPPPADIETVQAGDESVGVRAAPAKVP
jgi:uncharacterized protein with NAD-binding domain and iron-sulfur cluster